MRERRGFSAQVAEPGDHAISTIRHVATTFPARAAVAVALTIWLDFDIKPFSGPFLGSIAEEGHKISTRMSAGCEMLLKVVHKIKLVLRGFCGR